MSYCFNLNCSRPHNPDRNKFCLNCGTKLLLLDRYRAKEPIGQGGMARTFLATDEGRLGANCVIKQFLPLPEIKGDLSAMAKATELFEQEARQLLQLGDRNPQIPILLAYFEQDKHLYLVQEFIAGRNLWQELQQQGAFSEKQIIELLVSLLPVLEFIHDAGVIHRDIKPMNILRRNPDRHTAGQLVLIDFGISKQLSATSLTQTGTRAGTEGYAPMEQIRGGRAYPASDIYSLGVTCIELLTGATLDSLFDPIECRWLWREKLRTSGRSVGEVLARVLDTMLADSLRARYQSAREVLDDLRLALTATPEISPRKPDISSQSSTFPNQTSQNSPQKASQSPVPQSPVPQNQTAQNLASQNLTSQNLASPSPALQSRALQSRAPQNLAPQKSASQKSASQSQDWQCIQTLNGHGDAVRSLAISPTGVALGSGGKRILASAGNDRTIHLWQLEADGRARAWPEHSLKGASGHSGAVTAIAISPDGNILASGSDDKTIKIWQVRTGFLLRTFVGYANVGHYGAVKAIAISPDGKILASSSEDKTIKIWPLANRVSKRVPLITLNENSQAVLSLAISADGKTLASGGDDRIIKLWQLDSTKGNESLLPERNLTGSAGSVSALAFSPAADILASACTDNTIQVWDLANGDRLGNPKVHSSGFDCVAFSPDGNTLASGSQDNTIKLWDVNSGNLLSTLRGHKGAVRAIVFSPDGETLISGSQDKTIKIWKNGA
ncbi:MAG: protein kinase [Oscillatoria sp. SIO1A7]|nr:protein kinase [Oscillatoria sp. SIO1A7]